MKNQAVWSLAAVAVLAMASPVLAGGLANVSAVPHLDEAGRDGYREFLGSAPHRAFAIAPGGAWSWAGDMPTVEAARQGAMSGCAERAPVPCVLYAVDDDLIFDVAAWPRSWGPYKTGGEAASAPVGTGLGMRFPDLAVNGPDGAPVTLGDYRGDVVVLHFWATWCPPCRVELPELAALADEMKDEKEVRFLLLQIREPAAVSREWMKRAGLTVPLHDSGAMGFKDKTVALGDGNRIGDRTLAPVFPTTYVLDKHGIVVFAHPGPVADWAGYRNFLEDAARRSGR